AVPCDGLLTVTYIAHCAAGTITERDVFTRARKHGDLVYDYAKRDRAGASNIQRMSEQTEPGNVLGAPRADVERGTAGARVQASHAVTEHTRFVVGKLAAFGDGREERGADRLREDETVARPRRGVRQQTPRVRTPR